MFCRINDKIWWLSAFLYCLLFGFSTYYALTEGLWLDELNWTLYFIEKSGNYALLHSLAAMMYNLPLFYLLLKPIYLMTHNVFLLRLPSVIFSLVGVGVLQKIAAKIYGKYYSLLIPLLVFFTLMFTEVAANIRPYGLLFMLSALMIYMYDIRNHNADWRNIVVLGLLMILFAYTHWYASLLIAAYALSDLYLWCRKKVPFRCVLSYIICALGFVPWLVYLYSVHKTTSDYWGNIRSYFYAFSVIKQIGG